MKKLPNPVWEQIAKLLPPKLNRRIKRMAKESRRSPADCVALALDFGVNHIQEEHWFHSGVPQNPHVTD